MPKECFHPLWSSSLEVSSKGDNLGWQSHPVDLRAKEITRQHIKEGWEGTGCYEVPNQREVISNGSNDLQK